MSVIWRWQKNQFWVNCSFKWQVGGVQMQVLGLLSIARLRSVALFWSVDVLSLSSVKSIIYSIFSILKCILYSIIFVSIMCEHIPHRIMQQKQSERLVITSFIFISQYKDDVHTHCFPGARVLHVSVQIPAILKGDESVGSILLLGWTTPSCGRQRHRRVTSGAWSRRYAAHRPRLQSSCQDLFPRFDEDTKGSVDCLLCHGVKIRNCSLLIIGIFSGSVLVYFVLMACTPAESERNSYRTTSLSD